jgi:hypothetical protein
MDLEIVLVRVQQQLGPVVLDEEAVRQEQHMILVQRNIPCHVLLASRKVDHGSVVPTASIPPFAPCISREPGFF